MFRVIFNLARCPAQSTIGARGSPIRTKHASDAARWPCQRFFSNSASNSQYTLSTLCPTSPESPQQEVLDLSNKRDVVLTCKGEPVPLRYDGDKSFPPNTRGVLYYHRHPSRSNIRFRLCNSLADFKAGSDLRKDNGKRWTLTHDYMAAKHEYRPVLAMAREDIPSAGPIIEHHLSTRRPIETLSPEEFAIKGQRVCDLSNCMKVMLKILDLDLLNLPYAEPLRFPENTKGVFYYKQSKSAPTKIGELRFRLCSDPALFDEGTDLSSPSGLPWCISSERIIAHPTYAGIRQLLLRDGLLTEPLPLFRANPSSLLNSTVPIICSLNQPFVLDLAGLATRLCFKVDTHITPAIFMHLSCSLAESKRLGARYTGRVVVQFEKYPLQALQGRRLSRPPLFALRYLEFLTPVEVKSIGETPHTRPPTVGALLERSRVGSYIPWGYQPSNQLLAEQLLSLPEHPPSPE